MECIEVTGRPPESEREQVLAIGKFDGIHIGHQAILREALRHRNGALLSVMSIWPHPAWVFARKPGYDRSLTPLPEKVRILAGFGVQRLYDVRFSQEYARTPAEAFVREHLGRLRLNRVVVGFDFHFGQGGRADASELTRLCAEMGVPVSVVEPVEAGGVKVSSSRIRELLGSGLVEAAEGLLGRPYTVTGTVVHGDAVGRTIGFPTANLGGLDEYVLPAPGVYAVTVEILGTQPDAGNWFGVLNAGFRPTVDGRQYRMEVHLLDYSGDLYGRTLRVSFLRRVRDEMRFPGLEALRDQIARDVAFARRMLGLSE
ncbi:riboflavin biosynthesis protein RibF [Alicyclobacillus sp.]|uniref:riboflavin biosynthesis protein RibF n=1 Tax=Alicyclobacillus sp. TaxID=61169 RepID=UPI0025C550C9|nr:riboflavin biosynthesis protein RibF [Alicyclobacillus sp.]MCL6516211.1 riboflavin biosynthesis protein RibF [Alicyclobacillus sp.]